MEAIPAVVWVYLAFFWTVFILAVIGYVLNIVKVLGRRDQPSNILALRLIGILMPAIGAIVGWL